MRPGEHADARRRDAGTILRSYRRTLAERSPATAGALPLRRLRPQGGRSRQRRHPRLDRAADRPRRPAIRCSSRSRRRRPRCWSRSSARASTTTTASGSSRGSDSCRRPATSCSAGCAPPARRGRAGLLRPPAVGREGIGAGRADEARRLMPRTPGSAAGHWPERTRDPATRSRSRATSAASDRFDRALADVRRVLRRPERARLRGHARAVDAGPIVAQTAVCATIVPASTASRMTA